MGSGISASEIKRLAELHPKPAHLKFQYGTAGFRTTASTLDSVLYRVGIIAALRSKFCDGNTIGVMVTASHNPEHDNGVKLIDPRGEMLHASWEEHATSLCNFADPQIFVDELQKFVVNQKIDLSRPSRVLYARDTRPSGPALVKALEDGIEVMKAEARNEGVTTTPIVHYLVRCLNTKGTKDEYGEPTKEGYYKKLGDSFKKLLGNRKPSDLIVDCANGVGCFALEEFYASLGPVMKFIPVNNDTTTPGLLNHNAGADYVKTNQRFPPAVVPLLQPGQRACSFDGDADRIIYYYLDERKQFRLLDGDKIAALVSGFIIDMVKGAGLEGKLEVGVVQTAYANGSSTKYLHQKGLPVKCVPTGVKYLHNAAEHFDIGVYFEANGHGTALFSPRFADVFARHEPDTPAKLTCLNHLMALTQLINQTVGDAISDMLLVEVILAHKHYNAYEWDAGYTDLPNRLLKVQVPDRHLFKTEDAERRLVAPAGLQDKIDATVRKYDGGRAFVRPSGTEDVVRIYAEATIKPQAEELAEKIASMVYDDARSKDFR